MGNDRCNAVQKLLGIKLSSYFAGRIQVRFRGSTIDGDTVIGYTDVPLHSNRAALQHSYLLCSSVCMLLYEPYTTYSHYLSRLFIRSASLDVMAFMDALKDT